MITLIRICELAFPTFRSDAVNRILKIPVHFFGGVKVNMSPIIEIRLNLNFPNVICEGSPKTPAIFLASGILKLAPPACSLDFASFALYLLLT